MKPAIIFTRGDSIEGTSMQYAECQDWCTENGYSDRAVVVNDLDLLLRLWRQGDTLVVLHLSYLSETPNVIARIREVAADTGVEVKVVNA